MRLFVMLCGLLLAAGCQAHRPVLSVSALPAPASEALAGGRAAAAVERIYGGMLDNPRANGRIAQVLERLSRADAWPAEPLQCRLLGSDRLNALSVPGGRIYITAGLWQRLDSDDLLAAVLAHEAAHLLARDGFKPRCADLDEALHRECAADLQGANWLKAAGYNPRAYIELMAVVRDAQPEGWSHARTEDLARRFPPSDITPLADGSREFTKPSHPAG